MEKGQQLEFWLRGTLPEIIPVLQPVAHAVLQAQIEVQEALLHFPETLLWHKPAGVASVAFHLQHLAGVLDRLFTYAKGEQLSEEQLTILQNEGKEDTSICLADLVQRFNSQVELSINQLKNTTEKSLTETRGVGRKQIPSTVLGLLFHAAEHSQRHTGQLLVTAKILMDK
ncbi:MAG: DinB family protein [Chitinophagaceae bacterium]